MNRDFKYIILIILSFNSLIFAKKGLELIHAENTYGMMRDSQQLRIFEGNVHFRQDTLDMYCQSAIFFETQNLLKFKYNVLIDNGKRIIEADSIDYSPDNKTAVCMGHVKIYGEGDSLYACYFKYNFKTEKAEGRENLYIFSAKDQTYIRGEKGMFDPNKNYGRVEVKAHFTQIDTAAGDTMNIWAETLIYNGKPQNRALAIDSVTITQGALKTVCDTAIYFKDDDLIWLRGSPHVWFEDSELEGKRINVILDSM